MRGQGHEIYQLKPTSEKYGGDWTGPGVRQDSGRDVIQWRRQGTDWVLL